MGRILSYLKKHIPTIIVILALLVVQAVCDLSLPQYTSDVVDVGIQQGGIESGLPKVLRGTQKAWLELFMTKEEIGEFDRAYQFIDTKKLSEKELAHYRKKYPVVGVTDLYERSKLDQEEESRLETMAATPMMLVSMFTSNTGDAKQMRGEMLGPMEEKLGAPMPEDPESLFAIFSAMPKEGLLEMRKKAEEEMAGVSESILSQMAISFTREEYAAVGMNVERLQTSYLGRAGAKMLGVSLVIMAAMILVGFLAARVAAKVGLELRTKIFSKVVSFSNAEIDRFSTASLITRSTNDIQQIQMVMVMLLRMVLYAPIIGIGGIIKVMNNDTSMSWIILVAVVAIICLVSIIYAVAMPKFKIMQTLVDKVNLVMREILTGLPVIRAFSTERYEEKRFDKSNKDLTRTMLFTNRAMTFMMPAMMLIMNIIMVMIIWFGAKGINVGNLQVGDMIAFMTYTMQIVMAFLMITMVSIMIPRAAVAAGRIDEVLNTEGTIRDPQKDCSDRASGKAVVEFDHVSFRYPQAEEDVLEDITFTARPGETTAFIGSTGSGKSTLINLIPRFYDATGGAVRINGVDVRDMSLHSLRDMLGYVPQKGILFSGTIASNLRYGKEEASDEEIADAAKIAQATEFIEEKPDRYDTEIAQGGVNVSGGQKQRLSIARAIAKKPLIFIFDDSFSALDYKTDVKLRRALKEKTKDSTVLIVAQRVSTIMHAEQIVVLDEGRIAGIGTHEELLKTNEVYRQIAGSQLSEQELMAGGAAE